MTVFDPSWLLNGLLLLFDCPYVEKMAHFNIYLHIHKNMTKRTKYYVNYLLDTYVIDIGHYHYI